MIFSADLKRVFSSNPDLVFAVLVGSRADGSAHANSDWDFAVLWKASMDWMTRVAAHESLRREVALALNVTEACIDLIDLSRASLTMRANVAENGVILKGEGSLDWVHFLNRTWRELEFYYWEQSHAA
ncbi:MAG: nucleotidyltransferase domain-containing protein [Betaproteobacteria bacterium]